MLAGAARPRGILSVTALPPEQRVPVARLLLHAATCHLYALAPPPAPLWPPETACDGGVSAAGIATSRNGSEQRQEASRAAPSKWPYDEPCCEPLFAALSVRQQFVLISDVLTAVWCPSGADRCARAGTGGCPVQWASRKVAPAGICSSLPSSTNPACPLAQPLHPCLLAPLQRQRDADPRIGAARALPARGHPRDV